MARAKRPKRARRECAGHPPDHRHTDLTAYEQHPSSAVASICSGRTGRSKAITWHPRWRAGIGGSHARSHALPSPLHLQLRPNTPHQRLHLVQRMALSAHWCYSSRTAVFCLLSRLRILTASSPSSSFSTVSGRASGQGEGAAEAALGALPQNKLPLGPLTRRSPRMVGSCPPLHLYLFAAHSGTSARMITRSSVARIHGG